MEHCLRLKKPIIDGLLYVSTDFKSVPRIGFVKNLRE